MALTAYTSYVLSIIRLFCYNNDNTMDPKMSVIMRFQCISFIEILKYCATGVLMLIPFSISYLKQFSEIEIDLRWKSGYLGENLFKLMDLECYFFNVLYCAWSRCYGDEWWQIFYLKSIISFYL